MFGGLDLEDLGGETVRVGVCVWVRLGGGNVGLDLEGDEVLVGEL